MGMWGEYVSVAERREKAKKAMEQLRKKGQLIEPIEIEGRLITKQFWGNQWCDHLATFADYENRLPRGRTYARNGSICHLNIKKGQIEAIVSGTRLYNIAINIKTLDNGKWEAIKKSCTGQIGSILELLQGKLSDQVMKVVVDAKIGLFPSEAEIDFDCSCPDWAGMCKHVAAVLYGIGNRLDSRPELLFLLRGVDASELVDTTFMIDTETSAAQIEHEALAELFGIEMDALPEVKPRNAPKKKSKTRSKSR